MKTPSAPALERGLAVLELIANARASLTLPEIAKKLKLPKSSVHCLLVTLERQNYLQRNERTARYMFGPKLFSLANVSLSGLKVRQIAAPHMLVLTQRTGLATHLAVLERNEAVLVEKAEPRGVLKLATWLGKRMDLHCTGVGKALLSQMNDDEVARIVCETGLPRHNDNSITSIRKLQQELARGRKLGFFVDDEEDEIGYRCVGAPIFDETGQVAAAISVSGTTLQVREDNSNLLAEQLVRTAQSISHSLAGHSSNPARELSTAS
jgi:DNA-binding IclR family transcriptional regulator